MKLVIDIPEEDYERFKKYQDRKHVDGMISVNVIANGTPLPKGHGRLTEINIIQSMARKKAEDYFLEGRYYYGGYVNFPVF